jgi:drug/metabolite transporter (DMT)-like permease
VIHDPVALALAASVCFGTALVVTQFGLRHVSPRRGALVSIPTSALLLWLVAPLLLSPAGARLDATAIFLAVGLLFPAGVTLLTFMANRRMGPSVTGALGNLTPLIAITLAVLLFGETLRPLHALGIAIIVAGVTVLSIDRRWAGGRWPVWLIALPLAAAAIRGAVQPITKLGLALWPDPFAATLLGYSVSSLVVGALALTTPAPAPQGDPRRGTAWFAAVGLCNGVAVLLLYAALAHGPVALVSPLVATYPLVTLVLSALCFRAARIAPRQMLGVAVTVIGIAVLLTA